jgi:hypothetical protein
VKDIVTEHERNPVATNEVLTDDERLGESPGRWLGRVAQLDTEVATVAEQSPERGLVIGGRDDQDVPDTGLHERGQRVVDHRFVVHRHQLLGDGLRDRPESSAGTAGEDDPLHDRAPAASRLT